MRDSDHHVYPVNDLVEHDTNGGDCVCGPTTQPVERDDGSIGYVIVHHSLDDREQHEAILPSSRSVKVCNTPGCPTLVDRGKCDPCQRTYEAKRPNATTRGYDGAWQQARAAYLAEHPFCECENCETKPIEQRPPAVDVHHRDERGPNGPRGLDPSNLQAMSKGHHSSHTGRHRSPIPHR